MLIWFWQVICVHTNLIRFEIVKKNVYLDKFRNHATMTLCSKSFFFWFLKVISMFFFFRRCYSFMLLNLSNLHTAVLILSTRECVWSWLTNVHSPHLKKMYIFLLHTQSFHVTCLSPLNTSIKFTERKTALERVNCNYVGARKFSLKTSLGQMGKQFYTTQLDWNQDFVVLV